MANELQLFHHERFGSVRRVDVDGKIGLVASDVAKALGYSNTRDAVMRHCKGVVKRDTLTSGGNQQVNIIFKPDLWRLAAHSELPGAEEFESWIYDEVLTSIDAHGAYLTPAKIEEALLNPDTIIQLATQLKTEREQRHALQLEMRRKDAVIAELEPDAAYCRTILRNKGTVNINAIAKDYGMSANRMNKLLHGLSIQYYQDRQWLLYAPYQDKGYTHSQTIEFLRKDGTPDVQSHTQWTQAGRMFLYGVLKGQGILPVIERQIGGAAV